MHLTQASESNILVRFFTHQVKNEFDAVVDKCEVVIYTDPAECTRVRHEVAIPTFEKRDERLDNLTDESVDVYYSCILCQAFSPSHVCVVTPERLGLCGAVSWLDAKATNELDPDRSVSGDHKRKTDR